MPSYRGLPDTILEYEAARAARLGEGRVLAMAATTQGAHTDAGAVYLLGYVAEAALKSAYLRVMGHGPVTPVGKQVLKTVQARLKAAGVIADPESFHGLEFWCEALVLARAQKAIAFSTQVETELRAKVALVYDLWWVEMRYKQPRTTAIERQEVLAAAAWFDAQYTTLTS
jgi:hypothetical protein